MREMKRHLIILLSIFLLIISNLSIGDACTIFNATRGDLTLVGNNEDWLPDMKAVESKVWFIPATQEIYGGIYFGWKYAGAEGGMNDHGLFFDWVALRPKVPLTPSPGKLNDNDCISELILEKCATVTEAISVLEKYNIPQFGWADLMLADKAGASIIAGWDFENNRLKITPKDTNYQLLGYGEPFLRPLFEMDNQTITIERFCSMVELARQGELTVYSNIYDLKNGMIYVYYNHDFNHVVTFNLQKELKKGKHLYDLYAIFPHAAKTDLYDALLKDLSKTQIIQIVSVGLILVSPFILWPIAFFLKKFRGREKVKPGFSIKIRVFSLMSRVLVLLNSILSFITLYVLMRYGSFIYKYGYGICSRQFAYITQLIFGLTLAQIIFSVLAWKIKNWSVIMRLHYSMIGITSLVFLYLLNLLGVLFK
jgi:hypothetical protein